MYYTFEKYDLNIALRINNQGGEFDVLVGNKKLGYKKIGHGESSTEYDHIDIQYDGYYMSPLEPRILVVVTLIGRINNYLGGIEDYDHLEGEEKITKCYFFGCNPCPELLEHFGPVTRCTALNSYGLLIRIQLQITEFYFLDFVMKVFVLGA